MNVVCMIFLLKFMYLYQM
uniref:Uncharacterized protein n=1 Tax=Rhizophora mucronata TaxID=61149 RepID=A0A2P2IYG0_RHIMU